MANTTHLFPAAAQPQTKSLGSYRDKTGIPATPEANALPQGLVQSQQMGAPSWYTQGQRAASTGTPYTVPGNVISALLRPETSWFNG